MPPPRLAVQRRPVRLPHLELPLAATFLVQPRRAAPRQPEVPAGRRSPPVAGALAVRAAVLVRPPPPSVAGAPDAT
jgi:hypothetical protein